MGPKVSIIIPIYNRENTIEETFKSIELQTYKHWEAIMVDDGSTDNSVLICDAYCKKDTRFKLLRRSILPKGANTCRNIGFQKSTGDYIQFIDSDDLISAKKIEDQIKILSQARPLSSIFCKWEKIEECLKDSLSANHQFIYKNYANPVDFLVDSWNYRCMTIPACWLISRHVIEASGLWDTTLLMNQDGEFICRVALNSSNILYDRNSIAYYRTPGETNISRQNSRQHIESKLNSYMSYQNNILKFKDDHIVRLSLSKIYAWFIYLHLIDNYDLAKKSEQLIIKLGFKKIPIVGPKRFIIIANIVGFKTAIVFTRKFKSLIKFLSITISTWLTRIAGIRMVSRKV